jgi:5-methylcytosine-specific restriction enzyme A
MSGWHRTSRHARGYGTAWDKLRLQILKRDSYRCRGGALRIAPAHEVDHIVPRAKGGTDDPANLRSVNRDCHKRLTAEQQGKAPKPVRRIGLDGFPLSDAAEP